MASTDPDAIERGLATHGVPTFADRPPVGASKPPLDELIRTCIESGEPRYKAAIIPLLISTGDEGGPALRRLAGGLPPAHVGWLRWLALAAVYLERAYRSDIAFLLGRQTRVPEVFDRGILPAPDEDLGESGLRALVAEIEAVEGGIVNWRRSLEDPLRGWLDQLWHERGVARAKARHAGAT